MIGKPKAEEPGVPELYVGNEAEFDEGGRKVIDHDGLEIGVFRIKGRFFAYENHCAHQGGPVCQGRIFKRVEEDLAPDGTSAGFKYSADRVHIVCPWHGYEYDLETGALPTNGKVRLRTFEVTIRDGDVYVAL